MKQVIFINNHVSSSDIVNTLCLVLSTHIYFYTYFYLYIYICAYILLLTHLLSAFYRWGNWGRELLSTTPSSHTWWGVKSGSLSRKFSFRTQAYAHCHYAKILTIQLLLSSDQLFSSDIILWDLSLLTSALWWNRCLPHLSLQHSIFNFIISYIILYNDCSCPIWLSI